MPWPRVGENVPEVVCPITVFSASQTFRCPRNTPRSSANNPQDTPMGKGKGAPDSWVMVVKPGRILYEMEGVSETEAREALRLAAHKLSIKTRIVVRGSEAD